MNSWWTYEHFSRHHENFKWGGWAEHMGFCHSMAMNSYHYSWVKLPSSIPKRLCQIGEDFDHQYLLCNIHKKRSSQSRPSLHPWDQKYCVSIIILLLVKDLDQEAPWMKAMCGKENRWWPVHPDVRWCSSMISCIIVQPEAVKWRFLFLERRSIQSTSYQESKQNQYPASWRNETWKTWT